MSLFSLGDLVLDLLADLMVVTNALKNGKEFRFVRKQDETDTECLPYVSQ